MNDATGGVTPGKIKETLGRMGVPEKPAAKAPAPQPRHDDSRGSVVARARAYLAKIDPAVSGQNGSGITFRVACALVLGFGLGIDEATPLMEEYSARCSPPWTPQEIRHKLESADEKTTVRGYLLNQERAQQQAHAQPAAHQPPPMEDLEPPPPPDESVTPFPVDVFPPRVADFVRQVAASKDCPVDFPAFGVLGVAAGAIGTSRKIMLKPDWGEFPTLYLGCVGIPSMSKSPSLMACMAPVFRKQEEMKHEFDDANRRWKEGGKEGDPPPFARCMTENFTVEQLAALLAQNPRGLLAWKDEFADWVEGLNQYKSGKGSDGNFFLSAWSCSPSMVDRKNLAAPIWVKRPFVSVLGGIQPERVSTIFGEMARSGNGFVDRVLWAYPHQRTSRATDISVDFEANRHWHEIVSGLYSLPFASGTDLRQEHEPFPMPLSEPARKAWRLWQKEHDDEIDGKDFPPELGSSWTKMRAHCARIILVLHLLHLLENRGDDETVSEDSVYHGCAVAEYLKANLFRIRDRMAASPLDLKVDRFIDWVRKHGGKVSVREVVRAGLCGIRSASEARAMFEQVADRGHGVVCSHTQTGGKVTTLFRMDVEDPPDGG